ncbi:MAG: hypothetical protein J6K48_05915 [Lachnospiraceae bacterium]|nr:hypothetical protein [Lachnospiraceae bacterium]
MGNYIHRIVSVISIIFLLGIVVCQAEKQPDIEEPEQSTVEYEPVPVSEVADALNQDIFGKLSRDWYSDTLREEISQYADEVKGEFEAVPYEGSVFPSELILMMEEQLYCLEEVDEIYGIYNDSYYDTLDALGAEEFRLDLNDTCIDCSGMFQISMASDEDDYVFVYWGGGSDGTYYVLLTKRADDKFVEVDEFQIENGQNGAVIRYGNDFYYVYLYKNYNLKEVDGIRIHKLGNDGAAENILIRYLPETYVWKNIYSNENAGFGEELEDYIDSIKDEITSDAYLENGGTEDPGVYFGDETEDMDFVVEKDVRIYYENHYHKIDFANIGVPVYMRKSNFIPSNSLCWHATGEFYLYDKAQDSAIALENMDLSWSPNIELVQIWFKEINEKVLTFRVYHISDYNYVLNVMLVEGDKVTQIRNDMFSPRRRMVITEGEIFHTGC